MNTRKVYQRLNVDDDVQQAMRLLYVRKRKSFHFVFFLLGERNGEPKYISTLPFTPNSYMVHNRVHVHKTSCLRQSYRVHDLVDIIPLEMYLSRSCPNYYFNYIFFLFSTIFRISQIFLVTQIIFTLDLLNQLNIGAFFLLFFISF